MVVSRDQAASQASRTSQRHDHDAAMNAVVTADADLTHMLVYLPALIASGPGSAEAQRGSFARLVCAMALGAYGARLASAGGFPPVAVVGLALERSGFRPNSRDLLLRHVYEGGAAAAATQVVRVWALGVYRRLQQDPRAAAGGRPMPPEPPMRGSCD